MTAAVCHRKIAIPVVKPTAKPEAKTQGNGIMQEFKDLLKVESDFYENMREELLMKYPNRFLLIHGEKVEGDFADEEAAITEGIRKFGAGPFLVRRSGEGEVVLSAPALTLGLLREPRECR